jgi:hypothetical protein
MYHRGLISRSVLSIVTFLALGWMETEAEAISVVIRQLTSTLQGLPCCAGINANGTVTFTSNADLTGENLAGNPQIFTMHADGTGLRQLTSFEAGTGSSVIAGRGSTIVFSDRFDPLRPNRERRQELFAIQADGSRLRQVTNLATLLFLPAIDASGETVAVQCTTPNPPEFGGAAEKICVARTDGSVVRRLTVSEPSQFCCPSITSGPFSDTTLTPGTHLVAFSSNKSDLIARNDDRFSTSFEIYVAEVDDALQAQRFRQLTFTPFPDRLDKFSPHISEDGSTVVWLATRAKTGPNGTFVPVSQLFSMHTDGSGLTALTDFEHQVGDPSLTADGKTIVFSFTGNPTGENPDGNEEIFLIRRDGTGLVQLTRTTAAENVFPRLDPTGQWLVWESSADLTGKNPDGSTEIFLARLNEEQGDLDDDAVPDAVDNCVDIANPDQQDSDNDGRGNACDADDDEDTVPDTADNCPTAANPDADGNGNGQGDACEPKAPAIAIDRDFFDFPPRRPGDFFDLPFTITNTGTDLLQGVVVHPKDPRFFLFTFQPHKTPVNAMFSLPPGVSKTLQVRFFSHTVGSFTDTMLVQSNDPNRPVVELTLAASAELSVGEIPPGTPRAYVLLGNTDGRGVRFYFLRAFFEAIQDFEEAGFAVIHNSSASARDVVEALADPDIEALWIGGHGLFIEDEISKEVRFLKVIRMVQGRITSDPREATPIDFDNPNHTILLQPNARVRYVYLMACGQDRPGWRALFPNATFFGWKDPVAVGWLALWQTFHENPEEDTLDNKSRVAFQKDTGTTGATPPPRLHPSLRVWTFTPVPGKPQRLQTIMNFRQNSFPLSSRLAQQLGDQKSHVIVVTDGGQRRKFLFGFAVTDGRITHEGRAFAEPTAKIVATDTALLQALRRPATLMDSFLAGEIRATSLQNGPGDPSQRPVPDAQTLFRAFARLIYGVALPEISLEAP